MITSQLHQTNRHLSVFSDDILSLGAKLVGATLTYHKGTVVTTCFVSGS